MELREIEVFLVLADELHFGNTGRKLFLSQSSVSETLRSLEGRLKGRLFERTSRKVELTPLGEQFLAEVAPAFHMMKEAFGRAAQTAQGVKERIRVGFIGGGLYELTIPVFDRFKTLVSDTELEMVELSYSEQATAVLDRQVDIAFCRGPIHAPGLVAGPPFMPDRPVLAVPTGHRLANEKIIDLEELQHERLITIPKIAGLETWHKANAPSHTPTGKPIPAGPTVNSVREGMLAVLSGQGVHLVMERAIEYYRTHGVSFVRVDRSRTIDTISLRRENETRVSVLTLERIAPKVAEEYGANTTTNTMIPAKEQPD